MKFILFISLSFFQFISLLHAQSKPNIILILADDLGFGDVQALNPKSKIPTPNLNALSASGMRFLDAHTNSSVCTPTRYGILTGRYCWRTSLKQGVLNGFSPALMDPNRSTIADVLKQQGYQTACIGKWHLGLDFQFKSKSTNSEDYQKKVLKTPLDYGFDHSFILPGSLNMAPYIYVDGDRVIEAATEMEPRSKHAITIISGGPKAPGFDFEGVVDTFTNKAIEFIESSTKNNSPYFLYFPLTAPHKPVLPTKHFMGKSKHGIYGDFVMQVDDIVGKIRHTLTKTKTSDKTLILFTSDNGSFMYRLDEHQKDHIQDYTAVGYHRSNHESNDKWRGTKADIYEAGHRVPFFVSWPEKIKANSVSDETICTTDIFNTFKEITTGQSSHKEAEDSYSFYPALIEQNLKRPPVIHHSIRGAFAIRKGDWKLIACTGSGGRQKPQGKPWDGYQLYNLKSDPSETKDVKDQFPEKLVELKSELKAITMKH